MTQILKDFRCGVRATGCLDNMTAKAQHRQFNKQNLTCSLPDALNRKSPQFGLGKVVFRITGVIIAEGGKLIVGSTANMINFMRSGFHSKVM